MMHHSKQKTLLLLLLTLPFSLYNAQGRWSNFLPGKYITAIETDSSGNKWIGTYSAGVYRVDSMGEFTQFSVDDGLLNNSVYSIAFDNENSIWIGTWGGLSKLDKNMNWKSYFDSDPKEITAIAIDDKGNKWIGRRSSEIEAYLTILTTDDSISTFHFPSSNTLSKIVMDRKQNKWLAFSGGYNSSGSIWLVDTNMVFTHIYMDSPEINLDYISGAEIDKSNNLWVAYKGVMIIDSQMHQSFITNEDGLLLRAVSDMEFDNEGNIWFASYEGIQILTKEKEWRYFTADSGLGDPKVTHLSVDEKKIWFGTWSGLWVFSGNIEDIENDDIIFNYSLKQNYPNPFNPTTKISYSIPQPGFVSLKVYNTLGQEVSTLVSEFKRPGNYEASFNASQLASGVYFYKIQAGTFAEVKKMLLLK